ncbi:hypothetical protein C450_03487 [Halococcus salifodinae DSM 8989]|uniref:Uncharacterized protein n=1 Tax=Halococcus salifodinae DSM 8989 TaxID=1227456 RepID=M0NC06_9EURY|nr:hypothetical protein C450_03487 [Halococcus salifodinae DSM 8989]
MIPRSVSSTIDVSSAAAVDGIVTGGVLRGRRPAVAVAGRSGVGWDGGRRWRSWWMKGEAASETSGRGLRRCCAVVVAESASSSTASERRAALRAADRSSGPSAREKTASERVFLVQIFARTLSARSARTGEVKRWVEAF